MVQFKNLNSKDSLVEFNRRILLYGDSGAGKTFLIGTAQDCPEMANVLVCDIDRGSTTLIGRDIAAARTVNTKDVEEVLWMFAQKKPEVAKIKTLVLDGCSELQNRNLADIAKEASQSATAKRQRDQDLNELADYKLDKSRLLRLFRMARDIEGITLIVTAWAKKTLPNIPGTQQANKDAAPTQISPAFTQGVADTLRGYCDDVHYLYFDPASGKRRLVTGNYGPVSAKTRIDSYASKLGYKQEDGTFVPILENPTFSQIVKLYRESVQAA